MNLPFTNIRQVLSLHNKVSPEKIFLTVITDKGREELSYGEFSARCHQTANFLQEDLHVEPEDIVTIFDNQPTVDAVLTMACWLVGAIVAFGVTPQDEESGRIKACFFRYQYEPLYTNFKDIVNNEYLSGRPLIQLGGVPTEGYPHFDTLVRSMPNSFFNDKPEPKLDTSAFQATISDPNWGPPTNSKVTVTQGELLVNCQSLATSQAITGNQRLISYFPISEYFPLSLALTTMSIFMTSLLVGGSLIIDARFYPHTKPELFWREIAASRLHIACLSIGQIAELIGYGRELKVLGKPIYGEGVYQQDITQLRHIYCPDAKGHDDLIKQFTELFPFPVVTNG